MSGMLELKNVSKSFDGMEVLKDISLHIAGGEFVSIVGPSGSGKSTILRLLTQALQADRGEMLFDGAPLSQAAHASPSCPSAMR